jgi:quinol monooxygenase YgiN
MRLFINSKIWSWHLPKIILQGHIIVPESDLTIVKNVLLSHIELTRAEQGCLVFKVTVDSLNSNKFNVYEEFCSQEAFSHHQIRVKQSIWGQVTHNVERHYKISNQQETSIR